MKRRALLATLPAALLAGCASRSDQPERTSPAASTTTETATATETPVSALEERPVPDPPSDPTVDETVAYVRDYERAVVYNDLLEEAPGEGRVRLQTDDVQTDVLAQPGGVLVASHTGGSIDYASGGYRRNRVLVLHWVGDGVHRHHPYNWYRCAEPAVDAEEAAKFQVYDFQDGQTDVSVAVRRGDERAFFDRYEFEDVSLVVQPGVVATDDEYEVSFAAQSGGVASVSWTPRPGLPSWWGLTAVVTPDGNVLAGVLDPEVDASFEGDLCRRTD